MDIPDLIPGVTTCCDKHSRICDSKGTQMSLCMSGGYQKQVHDALSLEIQCMLSVAGFSTKREEKDCFRTSDPDNGLKGDLTILNFPQSTSDRKCGARFNLPTPAG